ncbi:uncharacterized protein LOC132557967 [Ylistrum balloti]|uniref:uncharacterized protein LOC132557967 n=1 Tax=Ylistrum balloti TaxID=509963 RepID=UPI00290592E2|nr:uncharacterized protein LOC132557967 [Ylistrum balloti]
MLPQHCKILLRHEVQKHFESGREVIEVVVKVLQMHIKSLKMQSKEMADADGRLKRVGGKNEDLEQLLMTLASLHGDNSVSLKDLHKRMDSQITSLNRLLIDPSTKQSELFILDQIDKLTNEHSQAMVKFSKLHKVFNKKKRMMHKVQQQIDSCSYNGSESMSISELEMKLEHFKAETQAAGQKYRHALDTELKTRKEFIKNVEELESLFVKHEEKRLLTLVDCIGKYSTLLTAYNPRDKTYAILTDLTQLCMVYSPDEQIQKFLAQGCMELSFPVPQSKEGLHYMGQVNMKLNLEPDGFSVPPSEQLTRISDTSGNANRSLNESNGDRNRGRYSQDIDRKVSGLPVNTFYGNDTVKNGESTIHPNKYIPNDMVPEEFSRMTPRNAPDLPLIPKPHLCADTPIKTSPRNTNNLEGLPRIACPEAAMQRILSRDEKRPIQFSECDTMQEENMLPKLPRSMIGTPEKTNSHYKESINQSPNEPKHNEDKKLPNSVIAIGNKAAQTSKSRNASSSSHPIVRAKLRMEGNVLPKMPTLGKNVMSSVKGMSEQDNSGDLPPWLKSKTSFLPQLSMASKDGVESSNHQSDNVVNSEATRLPILHKSEPNTCTATATPLSYAKADSQGVNPSEPNRKDGFSILPSKPKVLIDTGNSQSLTVRPTTKNATSDILRSRHRVSVVKQSGYLDSGIAAGFRGSANNRDFKSQQEMVSGQQGHQGMVNTAVGSHSVVSTLQGSHRMIDVPYRSHRLQNTPQGPQGMVMAPLGPRGKADGSPNITQDSNCNPAIQPQRACAGAATNSRVKKEHLPEGNLSYTEGSRKEKCTEPVNFSNADRLLSKYDVRNLGIGDNDEEEEDICKKADRLLAMHDIRNICSEDSLIEKEI